jgi:hypothetical protein
VKAQYEVKSGITNGDIILDMELIIDGLKCSGGAAVI